MRIRFLALFAALLSAGLAQADPVSRGLPAPPMAVTKSAPESLEDLKALQDHARAVLDKVIPTTVCLRVGGATGSGVLVSKEGLIMTAGHVSGEPGRKLKVVLHDGRIVNGESLGRWTAIDSGMARITDPGEWPYAEVGESKGLKSGQWAIATGHPGGFKKDRPPVVRLGRVGVANDMMVQTDCTLVGGDSGGPLFDMTGKVIGIHSRIGQPIVANIHVPADTYRDTWAGLARGVSIGDTWLGVRADVDAKGCKLGEITEESPASKAGLLAGDQIVRFGGKEVASYDDMVKQLRLYKPGEDVAVQVQRGDEMVELTVTLGRRRDLPPERRGRPKE
jgi:serine protease Do